MPRFAYTARDRAGHAVSADLEAPSRKDALRLLATRGLQVSAVSELAAGPAGKKGAAKVAKPTAAEARVARRAAAVVPGKKECLSFLESLYDLMTSGLSAGEAVRLLSVRIKEPRLRSLCAGLWERISEGAPLSRAMAEQRELRRQLLTALAYPVFMVVVACGVILFFLFFLLPRLQTLLTSLGGKMPTSTKLLIGLSEFAIHYGVFVIIAAVLGAISFWRWRVSAAGRATTDAWLLQVPLVGPFIVSQTVLAFSQTLSVLLENGITAAEALRMTEKQIDNLVHRAAFNIATARVLEGEALSVALTRTGCFPDLVIDRLSVGENTGNVVPSLKQIATAYQKLISSQLSMFTKVIASGVLMAVFTFVGFIAFAIVSAVFQVSASFKLGG
ncbi:MAG: type II secretion system F family protein [Verrucomicrobia bacterium]|nr:type II secretion system F family protein [Verrucomicrobiota bacterium]